jgi:FkbM family methyltransferase
MKWVKGAGPNAYWVGSYEVARMCEFAKSLKKGDVVYDVGANVGIYSLIASSGVRTSGCVYAFEPLQRNLSYVRRHVTLNNLQNCTVIASAVCNREATLVFGGQMGALDSTSFT